MEQLYENPNVLALLENPGARKEFAEMIERQNEFEDAVDMFADAMKHKLALKTLEGYMGGLEAENEAEVERRLFDHWARMTQNGGDDFQIVDVANLLMMLWHIRKVGERTQDKF